MRSARRQSLHVLPACLLLLTAACGTSITLSFRVNRPPTLLTPGSVDLRATGGVTAHVLDEGGVCGAVDPSTEADAGQSSAQTFTLPQGTGRAFLLQLPIQMGDDYATLVAVVRPYARSGSSAITSNGPGFVLVKSGGVGQSLAVGDLAGVAGSISVNDDGRSGNIDVTLARVLPGKPTPSATQRPTSTLAQPASTATDVRLTGKFQCVARQEQPS